MEAMLVNENYSFLLRQVNGQFYVTCQTFNIIVEHTDLSEAYKKVIELRNKIIQKYNKVGLPLPVAQDNSRRSLRQFWANDYIFFLIKIATVIAVFALALAPIMRSAVSTFSLMNGTLARAMHLAGAATDLKNHEVLLSNMADTLDEVTPERREEIKMYLKRIVDNIRPFYDEVTPLFMPTVKQSQPDASDPTAYEATKNDVLKES